MKWEGGREVKWEGGREGGEVGGRDMLLEVMECY